MNLLQLPVRIILLLGLSCTQHIYGQSSGEEQFHILFDSIMGAENSGLFNGVGYLEKHRTINENHKFFLTQDFTRGRLDYFGQPYYDVELKYNIFEELLLAKLSHSGGETILQLINEKVERFSIGTNDFINIRDRNTQNISGFYELLYDNGRFQLLKKHARQLSEKRDKSFVYYEFKERQQDYLLRVDNNFQEIDSWRDLARLFPEQRRAIRAYSRSNSGLRKSNRDTFMANLLQVIDLPSSEANNRN